MTDKTWQHATIEAKVTYGLAAAAHTMQGAY